MQKNQLKEIQRALKANSSERNKEFFEKIVPGQQRIYGVKTPVLNDLVKKYKNGSFDLAEELWKSGALEEKMIAIKILEKTGKSDPDRLLKLFRKLSKGIDNWAVCDGLGMQFLRGIVKTHQREIFELAKRLNRSKDPWQRRLSLVMVEWYTRHNHLHGEIKDLIDHVENDKEYYVKKAVDWIKRNFKKGK
jgi:3-methyladenine DNA glycosylase AlkD